MPSEQAGISSHPSICPVGTFYSVAEDACFPYPMQGIVSVSLDVGFTSCNIVTKGKDGGGDGGACQPPADGCGGILYEWDPASCECICTDPIYDCGPGPGDLP